MTNNKKTSGQIIDKRFRLENELGSGGFKVVYKGVDLTTGDIVAVGFLHVEEHDDAMNAEARDRFLAEAKILASLQDGIPKPLAKYSKTVAKFVAFGYADDGENRGYYLVTEYISDETLRKRLSRSPNGLGVSTALKLAADLAAALAIIGSQGPNRAQLLVHRDLNPKNIMLRGARATLIDYGTAKIADTCREHVSVYVQHDYMAPEQRDRGVIGPPTDLYSLGLVIAEMLIGTPRFRKARKQSIAAVLEAVASSCPTLPEEIAALLARLLDGDINRRPQSAMEVFALLRPYAGDPDVIAPVAEIEELLQPKRATNRIACAVAMALFLAIAVLHALSPQAQEQKQKQKPEPSAVIDDGVCLLEQPSMSSCEVVPVVEPPPRSTPKVVKPAKVGEAAEEAARRIKQVELH